MAILYYFGAATARRRRSQDDAICGFMAQSVIAPSDTSAQFQLGTSPRCRPARPPGKLRCISRLLILAFLPCRTIRERRLWPGWRLIGVRGHDGAVGPIARRSMASGVHPPQGTTDRMGRKTHDEHGIFGDRTTLTSTRASSRVAPPSTGCSRCWCRELSLSRAITHPLDGYEKAILVGTRPSRPGWVGPGVSCAR